MYIATCRYNSGCTQHAVINAILGVEELLKVDPEIGPTIVSHILKVCKN